MLLDDSQVPLGPADVDRLVGQTLAALEPLCGVPLQFVRTPPETALPHQPVVTDGRTFGWVVWPDGRTYPANADAALSAAARVLGLTLAEQVVNRGLADEVLNAWDQLSFLYQVLRLSTTSLTIDQLAARLSALAMAAFACDNAFIVVRTGDGWVTASANGLADDDRLQWLELIKSEPDGVVVRNEGPRAFLGGRAPLATGGEAAFGLLGPAGGEWRARDRQLIEGLLAQIAMLLDGVVLQTRASADARMRQEIEIAAQIQATLQPGRLPQPPGYEFAGMVVPAAQVGGDFYDVREAGEGRIMALMGDVAGKGIPAAMLTSLVRAELRSQAAAQPSPRWALARANQALFPDLERLDTFATAVLVSLDPASGRLELASAGHTATLYWQARTRTAAELPSTGLPLGVTGEVRLGEQVLMMGPGDILVLYSDGVTEVEDSSGRLLGATGLEDVLCATEAASADVILGAISQAVDAHRGGAPMRDDLAALVIKRNGQGLMGRCRSFVLPATYASLRQLEPVVAEVLGSLAERVGLDTWLDETALAMAEHLSNIVRHAYGGESGLISGLIGLQGDRLVIETVDRGANVFDVLRLSGEPPPIPSLDQLPTEGGLGLPLIRAVMDTLHYERQLPGRNSWRLTRRLPGVQ